MSFENFSEPLKSNEVQRAPKLAWQPSTVDYHQIDNNAQAQLKQANQDCINGGMFPDLQFNFSAHKAPVLLAYDPIGSAEQTGTVTDYSSSKIGDQRFKSGMDWEQSTTDTRLPSEKLQDFLGALRRNGTNPENSKQYIQGELDKLMGVGEGLNGAKEATKGAAAAGLKALTDGTVADFLSKPKAINDPLFKTVSNALDAMSKGPNTTNKALEALGTALSQSSEHYSALPNRQKGHVIGEAMFGLTNPEGSTEAAEAGMKIAGTIATHVDAAVMQTIKQSIKAIDEIARTAPEAAQQSKQMLYEYLKGKGLTGPELEYAGVPKGYFDGIEPTGKGDNFNAMSKPGDLGGDAGLAKNPAPRSLSRIEARDWYNAKVAQIGEVEQQMRQEGKLAKEIFETTTNLRNEAKLQARELMKDRRMAKRLEIESPLKTTEEILAKYGGDYEKAIAASKRTNPIVNEKMDQLRKEQEQ